MKAFITFSVFVLGIGLTAIAPGMSIYKAYFTTTGLDWPLWVSVFLLPIIGFGVTFCAFMMIRDEVRWNRFLWASMKTLLGLIAVPLMLATVGLFMYSLFTGGLTLAQGALFPWALIIGAGNTFLVLQADSVN